MARAARGGLAATRRAAFGEENLRRLTHATFDGEINSQGNDCNQHSVKRLRT